MNSTLSFCLEAFRQHQAALRGDNPVASAVNEAFLGTVVSAMEVKDDGAAADADVVSVKTLTGLTFPVCTGAEAIAGMTLAALKTRIQKFEGIPYDQQRLIYKGMQLDDDSKLSDYKIEGGSFLHLVLRLRGGCFVSGTPITMADGTDKNIEDIEAGNEVQTCRILDGTCVNCTNTVLETFKLPNTAVPLVKLTFKGKSLVCTANHPFWVIGEGWSSCDPSLTPNCDGKAVRLLHKGSKIYGAGGTYHIQHVEHLTERQPVYNFAVESTHCYFASGLLAHNTTDPEIPTVESPVGSFLDPRWNRTYGPGAVHWEGDLQDGKDRGPSKYVCPTAPWKKYSLGVCASSDEFDIKYKGWPVVYHGTASARASSILQTGFRAGPGCFSDGSDVVYFSPSLKMCSHPRYATIYRKDGKYLQMAFQCRVNPACVWKKERQTVSANPSDPEFDMNEVEWLVRPPDGASCLCNVQNMFVCYAIMVRELECDPATLAESSWWRE